MKLFWITFFAVSMQASAATILFSDLGPGNSYSNSPSIVQGNNGGTRNWLTQAREFAVSGTGDFDVTQFDLAVLGNGIAPGTFMASIWTNNGSIPGAQIGAAFNLTGLPPAACCTGVVSQSGVTGITLTGGVQYWMVLGPQNSSDNSVAQWENNNQGSTSPIVASLDGGANWITENNPPTGKGTNAAFDVLGDPVSSAVPEPGSLMLLGAGLAALIAFRKRALP